MSSAGATRAGNPLSEMITTSGDDVKAEGDAVVAGPTSTRASSAAARPSEGGPSLRQRVLKFATLQTGDFVNETQDTEDVAEQKKRQASAIHDRASKLHAHSHVHHMTPKEKELLYSYEALDYETPQNDLYKAERREKDSKANSFPNIMRWVVFGVVGFITGTLAYCLAEGVDQLSEWKFDAVYTEIRNGELGAAYLILLGFALLYVAIATFLVAIIEPVAGGSGIPEVKAYLNGTNYLRYLRLKTLVVKAVGVMFSVAGGLTIGKEGPLVHSGAILGANISSMVGCQSCMRKKPKTHWMRQLSTMFRNDRDKRDFVSGGAAAGVAAAFGAPVGGILFALEEASSFWSIDLTWRTFLAAMVATLFLNVWKIVQTGNDTFSGLISFGPPLTGDGENAFHLRETPFFLILAIFGGLQGASFNSLNDRLCKWRRNVLAGRPYLRMLEALFIAFLTATFVFWATAIFNQCDSLNLVDKDLLGNCISGQDDSEECLLQPFDCEEGKYNTMATMLLQTWEKSIRGFFHNTVEYDYGALICFFFVMYFLAVITYGIAVPSGLFVPAILQGCAYGRLLGEGLRHALPEWDIHPGSYAVIGATASLGGISRMTISLTVILLETTNDISFVMPIMLTLMVSKWIGDQFNISLYDLHVELKCLPFVESRPSGNMYHLEAKDVMMQPVKLLPANPTVRQIVDLLASCQHNGFPVVSSGPAPRFQGIILRNNLHIMLKARAFGSAVEAKSRVSLEDFSTSLSSKYTPFDAEKDVREEDYGALVSLAPFMNPVPITVQGPCPVSRVFTLFRSLGLRHLVVVDNDNSVIGIITRKELMSSFDQDLF